MFVYSSTQTAKRKDKPVVKQKTTPKGGAQSMSFVGPAVHNKQTRKKVISPSFAEAKVTQSSDLADTSYRKPKKPVNHFQLILVVLAIGVMGVIYLAHVKATTTLFEERNKKQLDFERAQHRVEELQRRYERTISPSEIYDKATQTGFVHSGANDQIVTISE